MEAPGSRGTGPGGQPQAGEATEGHSGEDGISVVSRVRAGQDRGRKDPRAGWRCQAGRLWARRELHQGKESRFGALTVSK